MRNLLVILAACATTSFLTASWAYAGEDAAGRAEILGADTCVRAFFMFRTPVVAAEDGSLAVPMDGQDRSAKTTIGTKPLPEVKTPPPPAGWREASFDDSTWSQFSLDRPLEASSVWDATRAGAFGAAENRLICARAGFNVDDPAAMKDVRLTVEYVGGAAVYLNGLEIGRSHVPAGKLEFDALAEKYPDNLWLMDDGTPIYKLAPYGISDRVPKAQREQWEGFNALRYRRLAQVALPANALRKGLNVLAVEVHGAPINRGAAEAKRIPIGGMGRLPGLYAYCGLKSLSLTCAAGPAIRGRAAGPFIWRPDRAETVRTSSRGNPSESVRLAISGTRNGVFSDRLAVSSGSAEPVKGLKASVSDLVMAEGGSTGSPREALSSSKGGAKLPASAVSVRYATPFDPKKTHGPADMFDALLDVPAASPVVPVWITVRIPADAAAGEYLGKVTVEAEGLARTEVPLKVAVAAWKLPDPADWLVRNVGQSMNEELADFYGVPRWSDRHFEIIGRSLELMRQVNDRTAIVNLTIPGNRAYGNTESMVRWIKQPDGTFKHDFTVFDKYLDVIAKKLGKPLPLRLNIYMWYDKDKDGSLAFRKDGEGKYVSLLDPATGRLDRLEAPVFGSAESLAFWKPVLDEVRKKIVARGWWEAACIGDTRYVGGPEPATLAVLKQIWPDARILAQEHALSKNFGEFAVPITTTVWQTGKLLPRGYKGLWSKEPWIMCCTFDRDLHKESFPMVTYRMLPEKAIMCNHHGIFPIGVDLWWLIDEKGRRRGVGTGMAVGPAVSTCALLAPGPDGAVASERFEMFRESAQVCEAILFLQRTLDEGKVAGALAARVDALLDERGRQFVYGQRGAMPHCAGFPYGDRRVWLSLLEGLANGDAAIYAAADEVARGMAGR